MSEVQTGLAQNSACTLVITITSNKLHKQIN